MKNHKIKSLILPRFLSTISMLIILSVPASIPAQTGKSVKAKQAAQTVKLTARRGSGRDKNAGKKTRQPKKRNIGATSCAIQIKNNTKHLVYVYINGIDRGSVGVGGSFKSIENTGRIKVYTRTARNNYDFLYWGPNYFTCGSNLADGKIFLETNDAPK